MFYYAGPRQGQAAQLSKSRKKILTTTYKPFSESTYESHPLVQLGFVTFFFMSSKDLLGQ